MAVLGTSVAGCGVFISIQRERGMIKTRTEEDNLNFLSM